MTNLINGFPEILANSRFYIELKLDGSEEPVDAYFLDCRGFKRSQDIIEVCEVTPQRWGTAKTGQVVRTKVPGNVKTNNIVLKRGLTRSTTLWRWFEATQSGKWEQQRRDGSLNLYDQSGTVQARFFFYRAWPSSYTIADLSAGGTDVEIEELELAVEGFARDR